MMNVVYSFIGPLPDYAVDTVCQLRMFYDGPVYFIVSDLDSQYCPILRDTYNVEIVPYNDFKNEEFTEIVRHHESNFCIVNWISGRERLFIYCFERFFVLKTFMEKRNLENVFYLELDNLVYDNPTKWLPMFRKKDMAFMYNNDGQCSSGVSFIRSYNSLDLFLNVCKEEITHPTGFLSEMRVLHTLLKNHPEQVQLLPIHWPTDNYVSETYSGYEDYNDSLFDAAAIGIFLGGMDPCHTGGKIIYGIKSEFSLIDYTKYTYEWKIDDQGRKIPYVFN